MTDKKKKAKKKSRRSQKKYPHLDVRYNLKSRRDYLDNHHYVNGVKHNGKLVMPALDDEAKAYLDEFNKEYYNASFDTPWDYDGIHKMQVDRETIEDLKSQIRVIKKKRKKIFNKSPNTTTEEHRKLAEYYNQQIEEIEDFIYKVHPRREMDDMNNDRNADLSNMAKAGNMFDLVSWDTLNDDDLVEAGIDEELIKEEEWSPEDD